MLPVMLDPTRLRIGLAGRGALTLKRFQWFQKLGVTPEVFSDEPSPELQAAAGEIILPRLPDPGDLVALDVLWRSRSPVSPRRSRAFTLPVSGMSGP